MSDLEMPLVRGVVKRRHRVRGKRETGSWLEVVDAGKEARGWKLDDGALLEGQIGSVSSF
jgi:hypothetical protein